MLSAAARRLEPFNIGKVFRFTLHMYARYPPIMHIVHMHGFAYI